MSQNNQQKTWFLPLESTVLYRYHLHLAKATGRCNAWPTEPSTTMHCLLNIGLHGLLHPNYLEWVRCFTYIAQLRQLGLRGMWPTVPCIAYLQPPCKAYCVFNCLAWLTVRTMYGKNTVDSVTSCIAYYGLAAYCPLTTLHGLLTLHSLGISQPIQGPLQLILNAGGRALKDLMRCKKQFRGRTLKMYTETLPPQEDVIWGGGEVNIYISSQWGTWISDR